MQRPSSSHSHLFTRSRDFTESFSIGAHVCEDDEHVLLALVGQVLGGGEGKAGRDDTLDGWVIGKVKEERHSVRREGQSEAVATMRENALMNFLNFF